MAKRSQLFRLSFTCPHALILKPPPISTEGAASQQTRYFTLMVVGEAGGNLLSPPAVVPTVFFGVVASELLVGVPLSDRELLPDSKNPIFFVGVVGVLGAE